MRDTERQYWMVVTSLPNFRHDREELGFKINGVPHRWRKQVKKMNKGDKIVIYIAGAQKFGAITTVTGGYYHDTTKLWTDEDEMWPARWKTKPEIVLEDNELLDAKKLVPDLTFIKNEKYWGTYFQGSLRKIPEQDFKLIESEMRKIIASRTTEGKIEKRKIQKAPRNEKEYCDAIMELPLQANSLHDRIGEMLEEIGTWQGYNAQTRLKITPDHAYELDVAWLRGKNPEIAIEIQIGGNITEAKDRLAQARKFNYRKVIMVLKKSDLDRLNKLMKHELELRNWMDAWSIGAVYEMYESGRLFFDYYKKFQDSSYEEKSEVELIT